MATVLYQLSHRLITSSPTPSYHSGDRFYLHLCILRKLSLFDEARKLLDSPVGRAICSTNLYCDEVRREISRLSGHLLEEYERARQLIAEAK
jgi:N-terminal acetyltransferase B complex non-catalytic subunit